MMEEYKKQNNEVCKNLLNKTFFNSWSSNGLTISNYDELEFVVNGKCDQGCKYCYLTKFGNQLYPIELSNNNEIILKHCDMVLDWLYKRKMKPNISLFLGEVLTQDIGHILLNKIIDFYIKSNKKDKMIIASNMNFIHNQKYYDSFITIYNKALEHGIKIIISASIDGLYCDIHRPLKSGLVRNEEYYNKIFEFAKKYDAKFHPMLYDESMEYWIDNFLWFQKKFDEYDISWDSLYLLEVRNDGWTDKQLQHYSNFLIFLIDWVNEKAKLIDKNLIEFILEKNTFNIFNMFSSIGRGIGCSIQSSVQLRLADLTTHACHRLMYKPFSLWKFIDNGKEIIDIESLNLEMQIAIQSAVSNNFPYCEQCFIKSLCSCGCLGSQQETIGDLFTPIPSVCNMFHKKTSTILNKFKEMNIIKNLIEANIDPDKKNTIMNYFKLFKESNNNLITK